MSAVTALPFSPNFSEVRASPIRELSNLAADPDYISLAAGAPASDAFDLAGIRKASNEAFAENPLGCLEYGASEGLPELKQALIQLTRERGLEADGESVLVTSGSQQALDLIVRALIAPGDVVLVETSTYPGALQAFRLAGAVVKEVEADDDGMMPAALDIAIERLPVAPKLVYLGATFANPTGSTVPDARRRALLEVVTTRRVLLVEDDPYSALRFEGSSLPPIRSYAGALPAGSAYCVYLSTLSKIAMPGLRIGWMVGPPELIRRCVMAKQVSDMCASPWMQATAARYLMSRDFREHVPKLVTVYKERAIALMRAIADHLDQLVTYRPPVGGMFIYLKLRSEVSSANLFKQAVDRRVLIVPGTAFGSGQACSQSFRLSFSSCDAPKLLEGVRRLRLAHDACRSSVDKALSSPPDA